MNWHGLFSYQKDMAANMNSDTDKKTGAELFRVFTPITSTRQIKQRVTIGTLVMIGVCAISLVALGQHTSPDFIIMTAVLLCLCGLVFYDISSRRFWVNKMSDQFQGVVKQQNRLVREVARNRNDVLTLKDGLADTAIAVQAQGKRLAPSRSTEAKMIEAMAGHLGNLAAVKRTTMKKPVNSHILELEISPPQKKAPPQTDSEQAIGTDYSGFSDTIIKEMLNDAIRNDKVDLFMQPVVTLPQRQTKMYELYARVRAGGGSHLPAGRFMEVAEKEQIISTIDNLLLLRCLELLLEKLPYQGTAPTTPYILNISGATLRDRGFVGDLITFLATHRKMTSRLIFELPQAELSKLDNKSTAVLKALSKLGCRFSMDTIKSRQINLDLLKSCHIRYIKMDADWLIQESARENGLARILKLKKTLDASGIDLIVDRIESEAELLTLLDLDIDFGQGYLFGKPSSAAAYIQPYIPEQIRERNKERLAERTTTSPRRVA